MIIDTDSVNCDNDNDDDGYMASFHKFNLENEQGVENNLTRLVFPLASGSLTQI